MGLSTGETLQYTSERIIPYLAEHWPFALLTFLVALGLVFWSIRSFKVLAIAKSLSDFPKDARSWTTFYNFAICSFLYISIMLACYATLIATPELTSQIYKLIPTASPEGLNIKWIQDSKADWARPILSCLVLIGLFYEKSPIAFIERSIRQLLQRWASIPTRVAATIAQLKQGRFKLDDDRKRKVTEYVADKLGGNVRLPLLTILRRPKKGSVGYDLLQVASLAKAFKVWAIEEPPFKLLYTENKSEIELLLQKFDDLIPALGYYLLLRNKSRLTAEEELEVERKSNELIDSLSGLLNKFLVPFVCAVLQSARTPKGRLAVLKKFGYFPDVALENAAVIKFLKDDLACLVLFLVFVVYPLGWLFAATAFNYHAVHSYIFMAAAFPGMLAVLALCAVLPAIIFIEREARLVSSAPSQSSKNHVPFRRLHYFSYLVIGLVGGITAITALTAIQTFAQMIHDSSWHASISMLAITAEAMTPFGLVAGVIGIITALFMDTGKLFAGWFVVEGIVTAVAATAVAIVAVFIREDIELNNFSELFHLNSQLYAQHPKLLFSIPLVFAMGLCVGLIIPRAYYRYQVENLTNALSAEDESEAGHEGEGQDKDHLPTPDTPAVNPWAEPTASPR